MNQNCYFEEPPLIKAIEEENMPFIKLLVENGANVNAVGYFDKRVMDYALDVGNTTIISYLKSKGSMTDDESNIAYVQSMEIENQLKEAIKNNQAEEVENLLKENENLVLNTDLVKQIASIGAAEGRLYLIDFAISKQGFGVDEAVNLDNQNLLIIAAMNNKINSVNYLLDHGAKKDYKDYYNKKAIDYAHEKEIQELLREIK